MIHTTMEGVLNESTNTVHRRKIETPNPASVCGATDYVNRDRLRTTTVKQAIAHRDANKCGRCFEDGGGY